MASVAVFAHPAKNKSGFRSTTSWNPASGDLVGRPCCLLRKRGQRWLCQSWSRLGIPTVAEVCVGFVGWWLVWPSTGLFQFLTQLLQSKRKKIFAKLVCYRGKKAWPRFLRYFSQSWCWALCRISLSRLSCSLKFALVFYIYFKVVYCEAPLVMLRQSSRKKDVSRLHLFLFVGFLVDGPKIQKYS